MDKKLLRSLPIAIFAVLSCVVVLAWRHPEQLRSAGSFVPLFALALSAVLSLLTHLLIKSKETHRKARDVARLETKEREKAQQALNAAEARYHNLFDSSTDGLMFLDQYGRIAEANPAAAAMHGCERHEIAGAAFKDLIAPDLREHFDQFMRQLEQSGTATIDLVNLKKDGGSIDVAARFTKLKKVNEPRLLAILTDVSERKQAMKRHALLSRKAIAAQEEERSRLSVELHDELGQILTAIRLEMGWLQRNLPPSQEDHKVVFKNAVMLAENATSELRRICKGLRPALLDDLGIEPAMKLLVEEFTDRSNIDVSLDISADKSTSSIPPEISLCAYRIVQESLTNVRRHSKARNVAVSLRCDPKEISLSVSDDGVGFDLNNLSALQGCGVEGMKERANLVNGSIEIYSTQGEGTRIVFRASFDPLSER